MIVAIPCLLSVLITYKFTNAIERLLFALMMVQIESGQSHCTQMR